MNIKRIASYSLVLVCTLILTAGCMAGGTRGTGLTTNYGGTSGTGVSNTSYFMMHGQILDAKGGPMIGMPITVETRKRSEKVSTDGQGYYRANVVQELGEPVRFIFVNPIGDKVYFQTTPVDSVDQELNFNVDKRGTVRPVKEKK